MKFKLILTANIGLIVLLFLNIVWWHQTSLAIILGCFYLFIFSLYCGKFCFQSVNLIYSFLSGFFVLLSLYGLLGSLVYYFYQLNSLAVALLFLIISLAILAANWQRQQKIKIILRWPKLKAVNIILLSTYLLLWLISGYLIWQAQTTSSINSPWQVIAPEFFIVYLLALANLILLIFSNKNFLTNIAIALHFFLTTNIALIVYKLGFGFDPFIHQATENAIWQNGFILPKPFYYLGQYSLVIFLSHLLQIKVVLADKILLPFILSLCLPYFIYKSLRLSQGWPKYICRFFSLFFLIIPFSLFLVTNPQALANIWAIVIGFWGLIYLANKKMPIYVLAILTLATLAIHALSGLPLLFFLIILWLIKNYQPIYKYLLIALTFLGALALPLGLYLNSLFSIYRSQFTWPATTFWRWPNIFSQQYNIFLDLAYLYQYLFPIILFLFGLGAFIYLWRQKKWPIALTYGLTFVIIFCNSIFLKFFQVSSVISNEQDYFSQRVRQLSYYVLLILAIFGAYYFINKARQKTAKIFIMTLLLIALGSALYLSYPRFDDYDNSAFYNLSELDQQVVNFIENKSPEPYIVLANQMTSVAALQRFGFNRYYNNCYFYPIPTGDKLYQYFLDMVGDKTSKETMRLAMDLTGVKTAYFVLPAYWSQAAKIAEKTKPEADWAWAMAGQYYIFKFVK